MKTIVWITAALCLAASPAMAQQRGGGGLDRLLAWDANGDGAITRAEAEAGRLAMFARLDADDDGYLSEAERAAMRQGQRQGGRDRSAAADTDRDGRISRAEMNASPIRGFERIDANRDGVASADEIQAVRSRMNAG